MTSQPQEELRGEALRRAWINASYRPRPEPSAPEGYVLADWDHVDCAICTKAAAEPAPGMNIPALIRNVGFGILLWSWIAYVAWLVWRAF